MSGAIRGKVIVNDFYPLQAPNGAPNTYCFYWPHDKAIPSGWREVVTEELVASCPQCGHEGPYNNYRIATVPPKEERECRSCGFRGHPSVFRVPHPREFCAHLYAEIGFGAAAVRCTRDKGHEGRHAFRWEG